MAEGNKGGGGRRRGAVKPRTIDLDAQDVTPAPEKTPEDTAAPATGAAPEEPKASGHREASDAASGSERPATGAGEGQSAIEDAANTPVEGESPARDHPEATPDRVSTEDSERPNDASGASPGVQAATPASSSGGSLAGAAAAGALAAVIILAFAFFTGLLPRGGGDDAALGQVEQRLSQLESQQGGSEQTAAVDQRLSQLEERVAAQPEPQAPDLSAIEDRLAALEEEGGQAENAPDLSGIEQRLSELESRVEGLAQRGDDAIMTRLDEVDARVERFTRAAAASAAVSALSRRVEAGTPYGAELDTLRPLVAGNADMDTLSGHAQEGLATTGELASGLESQAGAIMQAGTEGDASQGILSRLASSARSLVQVRPAGPMEGDDRGAVLSRVEAALAAGDPEAAWNEWQGLDAEAREAAADWAARLEARVQAEGELAALADDAASAIAGTAGEEPAASSSPTSEEPAGQ